MNVVCSVTPSGGFDPEAYPVSVPGRIAEVVYKRKLKSVWVPKKSKHFADRRCGLDRKMQLGRMVLRPMLDGCAEIDTALEISRKFHDQPAAGASEIDCVRSEQTGVIDKCSRL
jgi:hypothetical protein